MYTIDEKVLESIKTEMKSVLGSYRKTDKGLNEVLKGWLKGKSPLLEMFSKHPNWNKDKLMISFDYNYSREFNQRAVSAFRAYISKNVSKEHGTSNAYFWDTPSKQAYYFLGCIREQFFDENMNYCINELNKANENFKIRNNMKSSKAIGKICSVLGWDKFPDYNKEYAKLCDALNPIKVKRHTCISLNPIDFLLMSNGNSWNSCHMIRYNGHSAGCFSSGTVSYMLDTSSFIFYTVDASHNGEDIELAPKLQRQVFGYKPNVLLQSRLYPQSMDFGGQDTYKDIREIVQKVIADCLEIPNMWVKKSDIYPHVKQTTRATAYPDYYHSRGTVTVTVHKSVIENNGESKLKKIMMGRPPICIKCGQKHSVQNRLVCSKCW